MWTPVRNTAVRVRQGWLPQPAYVWLGHTARLPGSRRSQHVTVPAFSSVWPRQSPAGTAWPHAHSRQEGCLCPACPDQPSQTLRLTPSWTAAERLRGFHLCQAHASLVPLCAPSTPHHQVKQSRGREAAGWEPRQQPRHLAGGRVAPRAAGQVTGGNGGGRQHPRALPAPPASSRPAPSCPSPPCSEPCWVSHPTSRGRGGQAMTGGPGAARCSGEDRWRSRGRL